MGETKSTVNQDSSTSRTQLPLVFYDGECPLCRREFAHYRRLRGAERLDWVDITKDETVLATYGLSRVVVMARFHVRDLTGHWLPEPGALLSSGRTCPPTDGWRVFCEPYVEPLLDRAYVRFARWRLGRTCDTKTYEPPGR
jgi:predicted DCC family thiol-disulfide oxidoreductase YuxK